MIKDGQQLDYLDWYSPDDELRVLTMGGMDAYFNHFSGEEAGADRIEPGTPVVGYRFMYRAPDGSYKSPFQVDPLTEGLETAMKNGVSPHLSQRDADQLREKWEDLKKNLPEHITKTFMLGESKVSMTDQGVNVDTEGRGYYYWPDKGMAEDYMKTFFSRGQETTPRKVIINTEYEPTNVNENAQIGERVQKVRHRAEYKSYLFGMIQKKTKDAYTEEVRTPIYGRVAGGYESKSYMSIQGFLDREDKSHYYSNINSKHQGPDMELFREKPYEPGSFRLGQSETVALDLGRFELHRVTGTAVPNTFGDSGFVMNEMMIDPEPLVSIEVNEAYEANQRYQQQTGQYLKGREF